MSAAFLSYSPPAANTIAVELPSSKSISNRLLMMQAFEPQIVIEHLSQADDTQLLKKALKENAETVFTDNAGTCMRFLTAYYACKKGAKVLLDGNDRMRQRPIQPLVDCLRQLGAHITYTQAQGYPPLLIEGTELSGGELKIDASISSQFASAILMCAPYFKSDTHLNINGEILSKPYLDMTCRLMQQLGIDITTNNNGIIVHCGNYKPCHITVEADWSSASYLYSMVAAQPQTKIFIPGLTLNSIQGDAVLASLYHTYYGVTTTAASNGVYIQSVSTANDDFFELNLSSYPDLVPALAVTSCLMNKPCVFKGIAHLAHKESNRLQALASELAKAGFNIYAEHDAIKIEKRKDISFKTKEVMTLNTYDDHRLAMSFAILTTHFENLHISNASCVSKSFPQYWDEMKKFGITMGR